MPSVNHQRPAELAGNARCNVLIKRSTRHSSPVGINGKNERCRSARLAIPDPDTHRKSLASLRH